MIRIYLIVIFTVFLFLSCHLFSIAFRDDPEKSVIKETLLLGPVGETTDNTPLFSWKRADNPATTYWLLVNDVSNFDSSCVLDIRNISSTSYQAVNELSSGTYYWKVKYIEDTSSTVWPWSEIGSFTILP